MITKDAGLVGHQALSPPWKSEVGTEAVCPRPETKPRLFQRSPDEKKWIAKARQGPFQLPSLYAWLGRDVSAKNGTACHLSLVP